jgi:large subunit ribosomal protein L13
LFTGDNVIIINAGKLSVSATHLAQKYYRHSNYPGGLRVDTLKDLLVRKPEYVVRQAVWGRLPKQNGRTDDKIYVYQSGEHQHLQNHN